MRAERWGPRTLDLDILLDRVIAREPSAPRALERVAGPAAVDRIDALHGFHAGDRMSHAVSQLLRSKALRKRDLIEQLSRTPCIEGRSWGWEGNQIWVDQGCRGRFGAR